ncbi:hypothetical protein D3C86_783600 [compost metagenome]
MLGGRIANLETLVAHAVVEGAGEPVGRAGRQSRRGGVDLAREGIQSPGCSIEVDGVQVRAHLRQVRAERPVRHEGVAHRILVGGQAGDDIQHIGLGIGRVSGVRRICGICGIGGALSGLGDVHRHLAGRRIVEGVGEKDPLLRQIGVRIDAVEVAADAAGRLEEGVRAADPGIQRDELDRPVQNGLTLDVEHVRLAVLAQLDVQPTRRALMIVAPDGQRANAVAARRDDAAIHQAFQLTCREQRRAADGPRSGNRAVIIDADMRQLRAVDPVVAGVPDRNAAVHFGALGQVQHARGDFGARRRVHVVPDAGQGRGSAAFLAQELEVRELGRVPDAGVTREDQAVPASSAIDRMACGQGRRRARLSQVGEPHLIVAVAH